MTDWSFMKYKYSLLGIFVALICYTGFLYAESVNPLTFSPSEWKFGMIEQGTKINRSVTVSNSSSMPVELDLISTCACIRLEPDKANIPAWGSAVFQLSYDSSDDSGITQKTFIANPDLPGSKPTQFLIEGIVRVVNITHGGAWVRNSPGYGGSLAATTVTLLYYFTPGCKSCTEFLSVALPRLEQDLGIRIEVERKNILEQKSWEELSTFAISSGSRIRAMPVLRAGNIILQGESEIREKLVGILNAATGKPKNGSIEAVSSKETEAAASTRIESKGITIISVIVAGFIDGINPCAFTTLIFLLSSLALAGKGRLDILTIGAFFSVGVFLTYFAIGLGVIGLLQVASTLAFVSGIIKWVLALALIVFSALSVYDFFLIRAGRSKEIILQLPDMLKRRIHASIRTRVRTAVLAGSSLSLGFLVSVFEFACTGQVYLPTLAYMVHTRKDSGAFILLALYNLCFITPLLGVFLASFFGVSSKRISGLFQSRMAFVKLLLAFVFLSLAILTIAA